MYKAFTGNYIQLERGKIRKTKLLIRKQFHTNVPFLYISWKY